MGSLFLLPTMYKLLLLAALAGAGYALEANCVFSGNLTGEISLTVDGNKTKLVGEITGLSAGSHGFHIHQTGDLSNNCAAAGGHYNPAQQNHGAPTSTVRHVGDLGNIVANDQGVAAVDIADELVKLEGDTSVLQRAIVVHQGADDLGLGGAEDSLTTGNAGARAGCCIITETAGSAAGPAAGARLTMLYLFVVLGLYLAI